MEEIFKYKIGSDLLICGRLIEKNSKIYIQSYDPVNGIPQKVFDENKTLLGEISSSKYWVLKKNLEPIQEQSEMIPLTEAFEFAEWTNKNGWIYFSHHKLWNSSILKTIKTTSELYEIFRKENK